MSAAANCLETAKTALECVPLDEANLCQDCNFISRAPLGRCVVCQSEALLQLARLLNDEDSSGG